MINLNLWKFNIGFGWFKGEPFKISITLFELTPDYPKGYMMLSVFDIHIFKFCFYFCLDLENQND